MQKGPQETLTVALVRDSAKTEVEVGEAQGKNVGCSICFSRWGGTK